LHGAVAVQENTGRGQFTTTYASSLEEEARMAAGPGKYDDLASYVREAARARAVIVIVIGGDKGGGFSVQAGEDVVLNLPALLRVVADDIEDGRDGG
jgi:hypothetical protein